MFLKVNTRLNETEKKQFFKEESTFETADFPTMSHRDRR